MSAIIIKPDGTKTETKPANGSDFSLKEAQTIVGGLVQLIVLTEGRIMLCNEEGKFNFADCAENPTATMLAHHVRAIAADDWIAGTVLVCDQRQFR